MPVWYVGSVYHAKGTFRNAADALDSPDVVVVKVLKPSGQFDEFGPVGASSEGVFEADVYVDEHGWWEVGFVGTGDPQAAGPVRFHVKRSRVLEHA